MKPQKKNYYLTMGMAIGLPLGIPLGWAIDNMSLGPVIGVVLGLLVGLLMEKRYNKTPLPGTFDTSPKHLRVLAVVLGLIVLFLGLAFLFYVLKHE